MALIDGLGVDGVNLDWERGANNSIPCFLQIWGNVSKAMRYGRSTTFLADLYIHAGD